MISEREKEISGTREWAVAEINCCQGCSHGCKYCYARHDLVEVKKILSAEQWLICQVIEEDVLRPQPLYSGQVMFPTHHDIVPENIEACITVLDNILKSGNRVLIVSKPNIASVSRICQEFSEVKEKILFRFTITARKKSIVQFWEPQAPSYKERKSCLEYAHTEGFATSVSVEPMLDTVDVAAMVYELLPWVTHSIWLGKMNRIEQRVVCDGEEMRSEIERIISGQRNGVIKKIYKELSGLAQIRWKESIKEIVGLKTASVSGLDV